MTGQRDREGRRRSGIWLPDQCWDWLADNTAEGMTRDDLVEGLILLAMDKQQGRRTAIVCPKCKGAEGEICFRCMGLRKVTVPAEPDENVGRRMLAEQWRRRPATGPAPTDTEWTMPFGAGDRAADPAPTDLPRGPGGQP